MRKVIFLLLFAVVLTVPVFAVSLDIPSPPESAQAYMPREPENLTEGIFEVLRKVVGELRPDLAEATGLCIRICAVVMMLSLVEFIPGENRNVVNLVGTVTVSGMLLSSSGTMIRLAADTVRQISDYGKLLLPVMSSALAAQGGITTSAVLYTGTALFDAILGSLVSSLLVPLLYFYLALAIGGRAVGGQMLKKCTDTLKSFMTWLLKTVLYIFTGYMTVTGVVSGSTDASALKAAKLTISGVVPVVGGILSDASEAVLVGAGTVKNAAGVYGLFAVAAIWVGPFLKIGSHYLMLRLTSLFCGIFGSKTVTDLILDFASAMGMLLGMTGALCLMMLISLICFMKGVG